MWEREEIVALVRLDLVLMELQMEWNNGKENLYGEEIG